MSFKVYSGARGSEYIPAERDRMLFREFSGLDEALGWAHRIQQSGAVPLLIEGDDGTLLNKQQIANALQHRSAEL
jgi:hypothetical protein